MLSLGGVPSVPDHSVLHWNAESTVRYGTMRIRILPCGDWEDHDEALREEDGMPNAPSDDYAVITLPDTLYL